MKAASPKSVESVPANSAEPIIDNYGKPKSATGLFLIGVIVVLAATIAVRLLKDQISETVMLGLVGALAGIGVFFLFLLAIGFIQLSANRRGDEFSKGLVNGMDSGVVVTDSEARIIYANHAYGEITGAYDARGCCQCRDGVFPERNRRPNHIPPRETGEERQNGIRGVSDALWPFDGARSGAAGTGCGFATWRMGITRTDLTVWQLSDVTNDRLAQESAFQELQHAIHYLDHAPAGFFSSEPDGRVVYLNSTLADWLGVDLALFKPGRLKTR